MAVSILPTHKNRKRINSASKVPKAPAPSDTPGIPVSQRLLAEFDDALAALEAVEMLASDVDGIIDGRAHAMYVLLKPINKQLFELRDRIGPRLCNDPIPMEDAQ